MSTSETSPTNPGDAARDGSETSAASPDAPPRAITPESRIEALREVNRGPSKLTFFWEWAKVWVVAVVLFLVVRTFLMEAFTIPSGSMENTLQVGDFLLVNKLAYGAEVPFTHLRLPRVRQPKRGDVIVFWWPKDPSKNLVKRLIGLPGDTLEMREGTVIRNDTALVEPYVVHSDPGEDVADDDFAWQDQYLPRTVAAAGYRPSRNNWGPLVVPKGNYFALGDNRDNSLDSRYWGFVPDSMLTGRPFVIYYSYAPDTLDAFDWLTRIRWTRLGERVH